MSDVLRPRVADMKLIQSVAVEWKEPATEIVRLMVEHWVRTGAEATAEHYALYDELRAEYDRPGVWNAKRRARLAAPAR